MSAIVSFQPNTFQNNTFQTHHIPVKIAFQLNAFQNNAFQTYIKPPITAFQANAFQRNAFQIAEQIESILYGVTAKSSVVRPIASLITAYMDLGGGADIINYNSYEPFEKKKILKKLLSINQVNASTGKINVELIKNNYNEQESINLLCALSDLFFNKKNLKQQLEEQQLINILSKLNLNKSNKAFIVDNDIANILISLDLL